MKNYFYINVILALLIFCIYQQSQLKKVKADREIYRSNTEILMSDVTKYRTKDSLSVISVSQLELKLSEYKKYRDNDLKLIESLKVDKNRLSKIVALQTETIYPVHGTFKDSITKDNSLKCITINDKWFDLNGCADENFKFSGRFVSRDSLLYVEHVIPKRFWFIKWGCRERRQEIVSRNPHTKIINAEYMTIRK